jgi:hypothetical protein
VSDELSGLRLSPFDEAELRWLFCEAEGDMGLQSGLGPMIERQRLGMRAHKASVPLGSIEGAEGPSQRQIDAVDRWRQVTGRLAQLPRQHRRTLESHYGVGLPRAQLVGLRDLGTWVGLLLLTAERQGVSRRSVEDACVGALHDDGKGEKPKALLVTLRRAAEAALVRASKAYTATGDGEREQQKGGTRAEKFRSFVRGEHE